MYAEKGASSFVIITMKILFHVSEIPYSEQLLKHHHQLLF